MSDKRKTLLALSLVSIVLIGIATMPTATVAAANSQGVPFVDGTYAKLSNGVWYKVVNTTPAFPLLNATGIDVGFSLFSFDNHQYGIAVSNDWGLNVTGKVWFYRVILVSNPDGSIRPSGDEVVVTTTAILVNGTYSEKHQRTITWYNATSNDPGTWTRLDGVRLGALQALASWAFAHPILAGLDMSALANLGWGLSLMQNDTVLPHNVPFAIFSYNIAEDFFPHFARTVSGVDAELMRLRHQLMGLVVYNDTNSNNIMDLNYRIVSSSVGTRFLGVTSSEAMYVFKPTYVLAVGSDWGSVPTYNSTAGSVDWSISLFGVHGNLVPVGGGISSVPTNIDQVSFAFHFVRPNNGDEAGVKVDEDIGQFAGVTTNSTLNKLSLAIAYFSYVENFQLHRYRLSMATNTIPSVNPEGNSTAYLPKLNVDGDGLQSGYIQIGGDNYTWGNGPQIETAYSNVLPWFFFNAQFNIVGNYSIAGIAFNKYMYFYEACFPKWGGYSIAHDPYFAVTSFSPSEGSPTLLLIVLGAGVGVGVAAVAVLLVKRRKPVATI